MVINELVEDQVTKVFLSLNDDLLLWLIEIQAKPKLRKSTERWLSLNLPTGPTHRYGGVPPWPVPVVSVRTLFAITFLIVKKCQNNFCFI